MKQILCLIVVVGVSVLATRQLLTPPRTVASPPAPPPPALLAQPLHDLTLNNPTGVLLGEAPAPPEALRGAVTAAPDLIVPEIRK